MGEFNSDGHYIYYCGQESLRRNGVALMVNKRVWSTSVKSQKQQNYLRSFPKQTIQHHSNPSLCPTTDAEEAEIEQFYEDLQPILELTPKKDVVFIIGDWNAKVGCQEIPGLISKFGLGVQVEAGQRLTEFCRQNTLVIDNSTCGHHQMVNTKIRLITFFETEDGETIESEKTRLWLRSSAPYSKIQA